MNDRPRLSVIICTYNMAREAPRTILSAVAPYQRDVEPRDYEVIVVDNGSTLPLSQADQSRLPAGLRFVRMPTPRPSPVFALNWAARELAKGANLLFAIDGARIFSDRLYASALSTLDLMGNAFVYTLSWHLGPKRQMSSVQEGYDVATEDRLIAASGWPAHPRALFDISVLAASARNGYFQSITESNAFAMSRELFERIGGYDERFTSPGGGLANLEMFGRYVTRPKALNVCLLSEGTFHQVHGGIATSGNVARESLRAEYRQIFGHDYRMPHYETFHYASGAMEFTRFIRQNSNTHAQHRSTWARWRNWFRTNPEEPPNK